MKIGIIGGGQLGMMMAQEAKHLGHTIISLDPNPICSITKYSDYHISKDYNNQKALEYLFQHCDVMTYEFENVDLDVLEQYIQKIPQKLEALRISRNRLTEKRFAQSLEIKTPKFNEINTKEDVFLPSIVKTMTGGYDGKGQYKIEWPQQISQIENIGNNPYICEEYIDFDYEISVVASRDTFGTIITYPIPRNTHKNGILHLSIVDNSIPNNISIQAIEYTKKIITELDYIGTLAVEYFVKKNEVIFNEFAPRPHNSGHYTIDGCNVSQFKNHILAIIGEHIIEPILHHKIAMINVLGQHHSYYGKSKNLPEAVIHDYGKHSNIENRKIGHINIPYKKDIELQKLLNTILKE